MEEINEEKVEEKIINKSPKKKIIIILISLILIIAGICTLIYYICQRKSESISYDQPIIESTSEDSIEEKTTENSIEKNEEEIATGISENEINSKEEIGSSEKAIEIDESTETKISSSKKSEVSSSSSETKSKANSTSSSTTNSSSKTSSSRKVLQDVVEEKELAETITKYGVVINTYNITSYNVYNDGTKEVKNTRKSTEYDRTNYSATTDELKAEAQSARSSNAGMINNVLENTNSYRREANETAINEITNRVDLVLDENLCLAANVRAVEMAYTNKMTHTRPNGSSCFSVLKDLGISYWICGENITAGQTSANGVSKSWKNSPVHYSNMINPSFGKIGIGVYKTGGAYYWVQLFTN